MVVYVVIRGEHCQGGSVKGIRYRLDEAEILAMLEKSYSGDWIQTDVHDPWTRKGNGDVVKMWENCGDFVQIEKWEVKGAIA